VTPLALWAAVALIALVATSMWAIAARQQAVYITSGISFAAWSWAAIVGGDVALANGGDPIWVRESAASIQFIALALAVISLVVFTLRLMGSYPSPDENAAEATEPTGNRQSTSRDRERRGRRRPE